MTGEWKQSTETPGHHGCRGVARQIMWQRLLTVLILIWLPGIAIRSVGQHAPQRETLSGGAGRSAATTSPPRPALRLVGERALLHGMLIEWAGGWHDRLRVAADGSVSFEVTAHEVAADATAQLLFDFVNAPETIVFYAGVDGQAVAELFAKDCKLYPARKIAQTFTGQGYIWGGGHVSGVKGRALVPQPAGDLFAVIAFHTSVVVRQTEVSHHFATVATAEQHAGLGEVVPLAALYLHEVAEVLAFAEQRRRGQKLDYHVAHAAAMQREAEIRGQGKLGGGFAGGGLRFLVPQAGRVGAWHQARHHHHSRLSAVGSALARFLLGRSSGREQVECRRAGK